MAIFTFNGAGVVRCEKEWGEGGGEELTGQLHRLTDRRSGSSRVGSVADRAGSGLSFTLPSACWRGAPHLHGVTLLLLAAAPGAPGRGRGGDTAPERGRLVFPV